MSTHAAGSLDDRRILIVGAGPTGISLACDLALRGVPFRIIDKRSSRDFRSKGIAFWPRTLEILEHLGVAGEACADGVHLKQIALWSGASRLTTISLDTVNSKFNFGLSFPQHDLESLLESRLTKAEVTVDWNTTLVDVHYDNGEALVALSNSSGVPEYAEFDWIVGCDGPGSTTRELAGIQMSATLERSAWLLCDARLGEHSIPPGVNYFTDKGTVLHTVAIPGGDLWRLTISVQGGQPDTAEWPEDRIIETVRSRCPLNIYIDQIQWARGYRVKQGSAETYKRGNVLIAGDAAHVHSPAGAQGINAGLQDAHNLGWKLAAVVRGLAPEALLDTYSLERRTVARSTVRLANRATRMATVDGDFRRQFRDTMWTLSDRTELGQKRVAPSMAGVSQRYPVSKSSKVLRVVRQCSRLTSSVLAGHRSHGCVVGDRCPNFKYSWRDGTFESDQWVWDFLSELDSTVLLWPGNGRTWDGVGGVIALARSIPMRTRIVVIGEHSNSSEMNCFSRLTWIPDSRGEITQGFKAAADTAIVVRPDRYIAARCRATAPGEVRAYFGTVGREE